MNQSTDLTSCAVCGHQTTQGCSACKQVFYCSFDHQKLHWAVHKPNCKTQPSLKSAMKTGHQDDQQIVVKVKEKDKPSPEEDPQKDVEILLGFKEALKRSDNYITPKRGASQRIKTSNKDKILTQEQLNQQLQNEHSSLRAQVVQKIATNDLQYAISQGKKLIEVSTKLCEVESGNKIQFYELLADQLMVAKIYIQQDDLVQSRELIITTQKKLLSFIYESNIYKSIRGQARSKEQEMVNQQDIKKVCSLLQLMASLFYACGDFKNCEALYVEYVKIIEDSNGLDSLLTSDAYFLVGVFYLQHKHYIQALACFKRSLNIRTFKVSGGRSEPIADCWYNIGIIYKQTGKKMKAIEMISKALEIRREIIGDVSLQVGMCLETLGKIYMQDHDYKSSLTKFSECFYIRRRLLNNTEHVDLIRISLLILNLYQAVKDKMFENYGGQKMQPILKNVIEKIQTTINDNNLKRYMSDDPDIMYIDAQSGKTQTILHDVRSLTTIQQYKQLTSGTVIQRTQEDEFDLDTIQPLKDEQEQSMNIQQYFMIRKELLKTFTIDQMILLEDLHNHLKQCLAMNPQFNLNKYIQSSNFLQSLGNVQFSILQDDNLWITDRQQQINKLQKPINNHFSKADLVKQESVQDNQQYLSEHDIDDDIRHNKQSVKPTQRRVTKLEQNNVIANKDVKNKQPPLQFQYAESEEASDGHQLDNCVPSMVQSKHAPLQIQGKFRPISILK